MVRPTWGNMVISPVGLTLLARNTYEHTGKRKLSYDIHVFRKKFCGMCVTTIFYDMCVNHSH
jgi:hypothetical protein